MTFGANKYIVSSEDKLWYSGQDYEISFDCCSLSEACRDKQGSGVWFQPAWMQQAAAESWRQRAMGLLGQQWAPEGQRAQREALAVIPRGSNHPLRQLAAAACNHWPLGQEGSPAAPGHHAKLPCSAWASLAALVHQGLPQARHFSSLWAQPSPSTGLPSLSISP